MDSYFKSKKNISTQFDFLNEEDFKVTLSNLIKKDTSKLQILNLKNPNILIIIWESFTKKVVDHKHGEIEITPFFNKLKDSSLYFGNIYASGDRTEKGLCAVLSGFSAQPLTSISKDMSRSKNLPFISKELSNEGYHNYFFYGGDSDFANMKTYLSFGKFEKIIDLNSFDKKYHTSKWGVYDEIIFEKFLFDIDHLQRPFFSTLLTLSSHEPFSTPNHLVINGKDEESMFFNSLNYTDDQLKNFISCFKQKKIWDSTLIVIVADHGHRLPKTNDKIDNFKIPLLITGGALKKEFLGVKRNQIGSQIDIAHTLLSQLDLENKSFSLSKNLLSLSPNEWAFFSFNNGFGMIDKDNKILHYNDSKLPILMNNSFKNGIAVQQKVCRDYYK
jgi:phosphoglycerol transferase MdoB-like AlkP superfamily enzyme